MDTGNIEKANGQCRAPEWYWHDGEVGPDKAYKSWLKRCRETRGITEEDISCAKDYNFEK